MSSHQPFDDFSSDSFKRIVQRQLGLSDDHFGLKCEATGWARPHPNHSDALAAFTPTLGYEVVRAFHIRETCYAPERNPNTTEACIPGLVNRSATADVVDCVPCPPGHFCRGGMATRCPKSTYNSLYGQSRLEACIQCPKEGVICDTGYSITVLKGWSVYLSSDPTPAAGGGGGASSTNSDLAGTEGSGLQANASASSIAVSNTSAAATARRVRRLSEEPTALAAPVLILPLRCPVPAACQGGAVGECAVGHTGVLCNECLAGYQPTRSGCMPSLQTGASVARFLGMLALVALGLTACFPWGGRTLAKQALLFCMRVVQRWMGHERSKAVITAATGVATFARHLMSKAALPIRCCARVYPLLLRSWVFAPAHPKLLVPLCKNLIAYAQSLGASRMLVTWPILFSEALALIDTWVNPEGMEIIRPLLSSSVSSENVTTALVSMPYTTPLLSAVLLPVVLMFYVQLLAMTTMGLRRIVSRHNQVWASSESSPTDLSLPPPLPPPSSALPPHPSTLPPPPPDLPQHPPNLPPPPPAPPPSPPAEDSPSPNFSVDAKPTVDSSVDAKPTVDSSVDAKPTATAFHALSTPRKASVRYFLSIACHPRVQTILAWACFFLLPSVMRAIFGAFDCLDLGGTKKVLRTAPSQLCNEPAWVPWQSFAAFAAVLYQGILPLASLMVLWYYHLGERMQRRLHLEEREHRSPEWLGLLETGYCPGRWWLAIIVEPLDLARRLLLTGGGIYFFSADTNVQMWLGYTTSGVGFLAHAFTQPYEYRSCNIIETLALLHIHLVYLSSAVLTTSAIETASDNALLRMQLAFHGALFGLIVFATLVALFWSKHLAATEAEEKRKEAEREEAERLREEAERLRAEEDAARRAKEAAAGRASWIGDLEAADYPRYSLDDDLGEGASPGAHVGLGHRQTCHGSRESMESTENVRDAQADDADSDLPGLRWELVSDESEDGDATHDPDLSSRSGSKVINEGLSSALAAGQLTFTPEELAFFGVEGLTWSFRIQSGGRWYRTVRYDLYIEDEARYREVGTLGELTWDARDYRRRISVFDREEDFSTLAGKWELHKTGKADIAKLRATGVDSDGLTGARDEPPKPPAPKRMNGAELFKSRRDLLMGGRRRSSVVASDTDEKPLDFMGWLMGLFFSPEGITASAGTTPTFADEPQGSYSSELVASVADPNGQRRSFGKRQSLGAAVGAMFPHPNRLQKRAPPRLRAQQGKSSKSTDIFAPVSV